MSLTTEETEPRVSRLRALLREARGILKTKGFKGLIREYGWKMFAIVFAYYLVRDVILYILLPWLIARQLWSET